MQQRYGLSAAAFAAKIGIEIFGTGVGKPMKPQSGLALDLAQRGQKLPGLVWFQIGQIGEVEGHVKVFDNLGDHPQAFLAGI
jgi:hypothetical protein